MSATLSPKRPLDQSAGLAWVFPYYAGFGFEWAARELQRKRETADDIVLDPWNGGGTTTVAAGSLGLRSIGIDMNPVATLAASARAVLAADPPKDRPAFRCDGGVPLPPADPLLKWFGEDAAGCIRSAAESITGTAAERAVLWLALFKTVRNLTTDAEGSNPTWVRSTGPDQRCHFAADDVLAALDEEVRGFYGRLDELGIERFQMPHLLTSDARCVPLRSESVSIVLTSPPYLTRIDYGVAFSRELAVVDRDPQSLDRRRRRLMGTTASRRALENARRPADLGESASELLDLVRSHPSKDSSGYYHRNFKQYLDDLQGSLRELDRIAVKGARIGLVVQDSYYKDVPVMLGEIVRDEAVGLGWTLTESTSHPVKRTLTTLNSAARRYPKSAVSEHVLWFLRGDGNE